MTENTLTVDKETCVGNCAECNCEGVPMDIKVVASQMEATEDSALSTSTIYKDITGATVLHVDHEETPPGHTYVVMDVSAEEGVLGILNFQNGPVKEAGVNGVTNEEVLSILLHRTKILNASYPCKENELAIDAMQQALNAFEYRTKERMVRGVEGTSEV